jgi:hypothetical protein
MLSPEMDGTVKLCVPELELDELVALAEDEALVEVFGAADLVADADALAECEWLGEAVADEDDSGVPVDAGTDVPGIADVAGAATDELDVLVPHAVRPAPVIMTAIIAAGTRHFPMRQSSVE